MIDHRVLKHFGVTSPGLTPSARLTAERPEIAALAVTSILVEWLEQPRMFAFTEGDLEPLVLDSARRPVITYAHVRGKAEMLIASINPKVNADVVALAALTICGMMTPSAWAAASVMP